MRARSIVVRLVVATTTVATLALGGGTAAHAVGPPHNITIGDVSIVEGNSGSANLTFTITQAGPATAGITVDYATADATATAGTDYTAVSGTAALASGGGSCKCATVDVPISGDTALEVDETFQMNLSNAVGGTITDAQGIGTITNDDFPHATIDDPSKAENAGPLTFTVTLDRAAPFDSVIGYSTAAGTATDGADYTGQTGTLTITAGSTSGTVDVPLLDDSVYEGDEDLTLNLTPTSGVVLDDTQGLGTITENDPVPDITVDDPTVAENGGTMTFTISLSTAAAVDTSVNYATSDNTATDGADYTGQTGTATILAGATSTTVDVPVLDDSVFEGDETLNLDLSGAVNGSIIDAQGQGTITEDDPAPTISVDSPTVGEAAGTMTFTLSLDTAAAVDTTVDYTTTDGSASDGLDYTGQTGTATILAGATSTTVDVPVLNDTIYEGDETFTLDLSNATNGTIGTSSGTGTITDDDAAPGVAIADGSVIEGNSGSKMLHLSVSLTNASAFDVSVDYATSDGTATAGSDYTATTGTLTVLTGDTLGEVLVPVMGDTTFEPSETFTVTLSNLVGTGTIDTATATGTITNDDKGPATLSLKVVKTPKQVKAKGLLEPASTGNKVTVTLSRYRNGGWAKVATKTVSVKKFGDRDSDGKPDAQYGAAFPRPAKGRYRFTAKFAGDADTLVVTKKVTFRI